MINWKQGLRKVLSHAVSLGFGLELLVADYPSGARRIFLFLWPFLLAAIDATIVDMAVKVMREKGRKETHSFRPTI
jgi:hypothetical protein